MRGPLRAVMKHVFLNKAGYSALTVFFAGWGMDENPFSGCSAVGSDLLMCFDYRDYGFDARLLETYESVRVVAWSLGVWMASALMASEPRLAVDAVAVNGTPFPVDDNRGIPVEVFRGTLNGMSQDTLARFDRRMCGGRAQLEEYAAVHPQRSVESLKAELEWIYGQAGRVAVSPRFRRAVAGRRDSIYPFANQVDAWRGICEVDEVDAAHYDRGLLCRLLRNGGAHG